MRRYTIVALVAAVMGATVVVAGTALAGSTSNTANGSVSKSAAVVPHFSTTTAVKVKGAAVVNADGSLARGSTLPFAASSSHVSGFVGAYQVVFHHNVTGCAYVATLGEPGAGEVTGGEITVAARSGNANAVFVQTDNSSGVATDEPFHLIVVC